MRDHLYKYHQTRIKIKNAYDSIEKQAESLKSTISYIKEGIKKGTYKPKNIREILQDEKKIKNDKQRNEIEQQKLYKIERDAIIKSIPNMRRELREQGASEEIIEELIKFRLADIEPEKTEQIDNERIDKVMFAMDILFDKVKSIEDSKPETYADAISLLIQDPDKFFVDYPKFFDKSQGKILSYFLKKYLPWLINIGIANDFFISQGIENIFTNRSFNTRYNSRNNRLLKSFQETGQLSESDLKHITEEVYNPKTLLNKIKGYAKTVTGKKSSRSFASILDYQFEREAEREKSNQTSTRPRVVRFANEAGQGPLVTHVGVTAPMYEGSNNMKKGKIFTNNPRSMKGTMTTIGQIHEHHNAKLLKILLRLGPLISNNPEELIKTLLPNTEKGFMPSSEAMEHVSMLFPKYEDYQNFIRNGHDQMDSLLIDILILQDLIPESNDSKETPHVLQTFTSNMKQIFGKLFRKKSKHFIKCKRLRDEHTVLY